MAIAPLYTQGQIERTFAEWHRRWVANPVDFMTDAECEAMKGKPYGEACGMFLVGIMKEQARADTCGMAIPTPPKE